MAVWSDTLWRSGIWLFYPSYGDPFWFCNREFCADGPVILDYVSGMSLLVIYKEDSFDVYYLDRLVELHPGVHFSMAALEERCLVDCYTSSGSALSSVAEHSDGQFQTATNSLKLNRLCTFFYLECVRDFYFLRRAA